MKSFEQLDKDQRGRAVEHAFVELVAHVVEGTIYFDGRLGNKIKEVTEGAEAAGQNIYSAVAKHLGDELRPLAYEAACVAHYSEETDQVVDGIADERENDLD